jgi:hypothetical protein
MAHAGARQRARQGHTHPARAPHLHAQGTAGRQSAHALARSRRDQGQGREVGPQPVQGRFLFAQGVRVRAAARRVVQQSRPGQPLHEPVDMAVGQTHALAFVAQERKSACPVEQDQKAARRRVHRAEHHRMCRCHPELHGVQIPPGAPKRGFHHRMHSRPPYVPVVPVVLVLLRRSIASMHASAVECRKLSTGWGYSSYKSGVRSRDKLGAQSADRHRTVPEAGLPACATGTVGACPPTH